MTVRIIHVAQICGTAVLVACEPIAGSTGILPAGPDTYTVTARNEGIFGGSAQAQQAALAEATQYCQRQNLVFVSATTNQVSGVTTPTWTGYTLTFRCLPGTDPAVTRFQPPRAPS